MNDDALVRADTLRRAAHDLKNPLTVVRVLSEMLLDDASEGTLATDLQDIVEAVDVAALNADSLADFARAEVSDGRNHPLTDVDLGVIAREAVARAAFRKRVRLAGEARGAAHASEAGVMRVLCAVLLNGRKMAGPQETLVVRVSERSIEVLHPGVSLDEDGVDALFSLYGAAALRERRVAASAFGLAASREAMRRMGGDLVAVGQPAGLSVVLTFGN